MTSPGTGGGGDEQERRRGAEELLPLPEEERRRQVADMTAELAEGDGEGSHTAPGGPVSPH